MIKQNSLGIKPRVPTAFQGKLEALECVSMILYCKASSQFMRWAKNKYDTLFF